MQTKTLLQLFCTCEFDIDKLLSIIILVLQVLIDTHIVLYMLTKLATAVYPYTSCIL